MKKLFLLIVILWSFTVAAAQKSPEPSAGGTVTAVSVVTANGVSGVVANPTTTPAITLNVAGLDASKIGGGGVSTAEFDFLSTLGSNAQTQIDAKQAALNVSNKLGLAAGGTNADLSGTGGTSQFLKQASVGAAITVVRPSCADLSDAGAGCSGAAGITNGAGANVVPKSNGTNLVASRITDPVAGTGDFTIEVLSSGNDNLILGDPAFTRIDIDPGNGAVSVFGANFSVENGAIHVGAGIFPMVEGVGDIGGDFDPFSNLYLGTDQTSNTQITSVATGLRVATLPDATGTFMLSSLAKLDPVAFASLPTPAEGMMAWVNDGKDKQLGQGHQCH